VSSRRTTEEERQRDNPLQFFRTPPWATWAVVKWRQHQFRGKRILELGGGDGMIAAEILSCEPLRLQEYVAVELDPGRAQMLREKLETLGGSVIEGDALTLDLEGHLFDVVVMNPPFDKAHLFLLAAQRYLKPGGIILMLQRCTYPCESQTGRDEMFKHDNPIGAALGFYAELTLTNRLDCKGDGKADSVNHSWFAFEPGWVLQDKIFLPTREHVRRAACPWDPNRDPELPRQKWKEEPPKQVALF
jgi:ubiquinone/menaquinone biosynthesis C-methylase UbiE